MSSTKPGQKTSKRMGPVGLLAAVLLGLAVAALPSAALAKTVTTVEIMDANGPSIAKVSVADARNGRPVASGVSDEATGQFAFPGNSNRDYIVTVHTQSGFVGSERVFAGELVTIVADQPAGALDPVTIQGGFGTVYWYDGSGEPVSGANVSVVTWSNFEPIERGKTDDNGKFRFKVPADLDRSDFLVTIWSDGRPTVLKIPLIQPNLGGGGEGGWPGF
jgi:hypothetical protein